jgi:hypothetical protein
MRDKTMILSVRPAKAGKFEARAGDRLLCTSRQPFLDAARVLLAEGVDPAAPITMRHERTGTDSLKSTVGEAAKLSVYETAFGPKFGPWVPFQWHRGPPVSAPGAVFPPPEAAEAPPAPGTGLAGPSAMAPEAHRRPAAGGLGATGPAS